MRIFKLSGNRKAELLLKILKVNWDLRGFFSCSLTVSQSCYWKLVKILKINWDLRALEGGGRGTSTKKENLLLAHYSYF